MLKIKKNTKINIIINNIYKIIKIFQIDKIIKIIKISNIYKICKILLQNNKYLTLSIIKILILNTKY